MLMDTGDLSVLLPVHQGLSNKIDNRLVRTANADFCLVLVLVKKCCIALSWHIGGRGEKFMDNDVLEEYHLEVTNK